MEKHYHILEERIYHELLLLNEPKAKKLSHSYFVALVGEELADEAYREIHPAMSWKASVMPFVDDPSMTPAQKSLWERMQPDWAAAIRESRKSKPGRKAFKAAYDNMVVHMMSISALSEEEQRLFLDDNLPERVVPEIGWHPRLVVTTFKQAVIEPTWIREAPLRQQKEALTKALAMYKKAREESRLASRQTSADEQSDGAETGQ